MTMTSSPSLSSGKCWLQLRVEQPDAQAHGDRAHVLADADAEGTIPLTRADTHEGIGYFSAPTPLLTEAIPLLNKIG